MSWKRRLLPLLATVPAAVAVAATATPAHAADTFRQITNNDNRKCIDVATQNNTTVQLWSCDGHNEQKWAETLDNGSFVFENEHTNKCLDIAGGSKDLFVPTAANPCSGSASQHWNVIFAFNPGTGHGFFQQLQNVNSGLCLDLTNNSSQNGTLLQQYVCQPNSVQNPSINNAQHWNL
jgi:hypothetical protein